MKWMPVQSDAVVLQQLFVVYFSGECFTPRDGLGAAEMQNVQTD